MKPVTPFGRGIEAAIARAEAGATENMLMIMPAVDCSRCGIASRMTSNMVVRLTATSILQRTIGQRQRHGRDAGIV